MYEKPSSIVSNYHHMFCELGYEQLDVIFYEDRSWSIIEYQNSPIVPSLTKWKVVLSNIRNVEFSESFVKRMVESLDLQKREFWERLEEESKEREENEKSILASRADLHARAAIEIAKNDRLMERAAKQGPSAFSLDSILKEMSPHQIRAVLGPQVQTFC